MRCKAPTPRRVRDCVCALSCVRARVRRQHETYTRLPTGLLAASVGVLTSGYWPTYPVLEMRLPAEADALQALFQEFYLSKYSGRRLVWQHNLGTAVLKAWFPKGAKELAVSTTQVWCAGLCASACRPEACGRRVWTRSAAPLWLHSSCGDVRGMAPRARARLLHSAPCTACCC